MKTIFPCLLMALAVLIAFSAPVGAQETAKPKGAYTSSLYHWKAVESNPALKAGEKGSWDENIRERMWVLYEEGAFTAWYAGWEGDYDKKRPNLVHLGRATSEDGLTWTKDPDNPIFTERWVEDMCVVKDKGTYYMFAEDESNDDTKIHLLTSSDGKQWKAEGTVLGKETQNGWERGWAATPLVWKEKDAWFMLYEGGPPGDIGLARSEDARNWRRFPGNPIIPQGKRDWENKAIAPDCLIKKDGRYILFYHACGKDDVFRSGVALSRDMVRWSRYSGNPISEGHSPVVVESAKGAFLYVSRNTEEGAVIDAYIPGPAPKPKTEVKPEAKPEEAKPEAK